MTLEDRERWFQTELRRIWEGEYLDNVRMLGNGLAHRTDPFITSPIDSARAIRSFAGVVDALWGTRASDDRDESG